MSIIRITKPQKTNYTNANGVYQDGVMAYAADSSDMIWGILGHTNLGGISVWSGNVLGNMKKQYTPEFDFLIGEAGQAFYGSRYPDGPLSRGGIWPCGLWIDPSDNTFYCYVHNETGWQAGKSSYTIYGQQEGEPDFRHIGLIKSKNQGRSWSFEGWVISSYYPSWSVRYTPENIVGGQEGNKICLCSGDFCVFPNKKDGYIYLFYTQSFYDCISKTVIEDKIYAARSLMSAKSEPGSWFKYYRGTFCEPGNCGKETAVAEDGAVPNVYYDNEYNLYLMSSYNRDAWMNGKCTCRLQFSRNLTEWSNPVWPAEERPDLSKPYFTLYRDQEKGKLQLFMESNGTDIEESALEIDFENMIRNEGKDII